MLRLLELLQSLFCGRESPVVFIVHEVRGISQMRNQLMVCRLHLCFHHFLCGFACTSSVPSKSARMFPSVRPWLRLQSLLSLDLRLRSTWMADCGVNLPGVVMFPKSFSRHRCRIGSWFWSSWSCCLCVRRVVVLWEFVSSVVYAASIDVLLFGVGVGFDRVRGRCRDEDVAMVAC